MGKKAKRFKVIATRNDPAYFLNDELIDLWLPSARPKWLDGWWYGNDDRSTFVCAKEFALKTGIKLAHGEKKILWITVEEGN